MSLKVNQRSHTEHNDIMTTHGHVWPHGEDTNKYHHIPPRTRKEKNRHHCFQGNRLILSYFTTPIVTWTAHSYTLLAVAECKWDCASSFTSKWNNAADQLSTSALECSSTFRCNVSPSHNWLVVKDSQKRVAHRLPWQQQHAPSPPPSQKKSYTLFNSFITFYKGVRERLNTGRNGHET